MKQSRNDLAKTGERTGIAFHESVSRAFHSARAPDAASQLAQKLASGEYAQAYHLAQDMRRSAGENAAILVLTARAAYLNNESAEAAIDLQKASALDPADIEAWTLLGLVRFDQDNEEASKSAFGRALALDPDNPEVQAVSAACGARGEYDWLPEIGRLEALHNADRENSLIAGMLVEACLYNGVRGWTQIENSGHGTLVTAAGKSWSIDANIPSGLYPTTALHIATATNMIARSKAVAGIDAAMQAQLRELEAVVADNRKRHLAASYAELGFAALYMFGGFMVMSGQSGNVAMGLLGILLGLAMIAGSFVPQWRGNRVAFTKSGLSLGERVTNLAQNFKYGPFVYLIIVLMFFPFIALFKLYVNVADELIVSQRLAAQTRDGGLVKTQTAFTDPSSAAPVLAAATGATAGQPVASGISQLALEPANGSGYAPEFSSVDTSGTATSPFTSSAGHAIQGLFARLLPERWIEHRHFRKAVYAYVASGILVTAGATWWVTRTAPPPAGATAITASQSLPLASQTITPPSASNTPAIIPTAVTNVTIGPDLDVNTDNPTGVIQPFAAPATQVTYIAQVSNAAGREFSAALYDDGGNQVASGCAWSTFLDAGVYRCQLTNLNLAAGNYHLAIADGIGGQFTSYFSVTAPPQDTNANAIVDGEPEIIDTATLSIDGHTLHLNGIVGLAGRSITAMVNFIREQGRIVSCTRVENGNYLCKTYTGHDVAAAALLNGAARAMEEGPDIYKSLEAQARAARRGIWRNG